MFGNGPGRFVFRTAYGKVLCERDQHAARFYNDQHVSEIVGGLRHSLQSADRSAHYAGDRAPRRKRQIENEVLGGCEKNGVKPFSFSRTSASRMGYRWVVGVRPYFFTA